MNSDTPELRSLRELEMEVLAEGREWIASGFNRSYNLKRTATAEFFPHSGRKAWHRRSQPMHLRTVVGVIELSIWQGQDPHDGHWGCPIRERWGLLAHQEMSPALEEKLAFTATLAVRMPTLSYWPRSGVARGTIRSSTHWCNAWESERRPKRSNGLKNYPRSVTGNGEPRSWRC